MNKLHYLLPGCVAVCLLAACASIGRPDGGPRDTEPPRYVRSTPAPGTTGFSGNKISIFFDENVQLDDPGSKVAISPTQLQQPTLFANGRRVDITLRDSILPDATYTIDLADAVKDLNEGNVLDGFAIDFSTGADIDTLAISGMVLQARNLEPAQGMLVGVYTGGADSCITTRRLERIARTNQLGQFTVRNLKPGSYQIFALNDLNRDYHWDRTEDVAFFDTLISPATELITVTDTVAPDSTVERPATRFLPDNVLLTWFNEDYRPQYLKTYKRDVRNIIRLEQNAPVDSLPQLTVVQTGGSGPIRRPLLDAALLSRTAGGDTLEYWLRDSALIASDTLLVETRYRRVDSLDNLVWATDTLKFNMRGRKGKDAPKFARTLQERIDSVLAKSDTARIDTFALMQPRMWLNMQLNSSTQDINRPLYVSVNRPVDSIPASVGIRLEYMPDSVWTLVEPQPRLVPADTVSHMRFVIDQKWIPGGKYRLAVDSMAVSDIYGYYTRPDSLDFTVRKTEDYSTVFFNVSGVPDSVSAIVELLNDSDTPVRTAPVSNGTATFDFLLPATYYARLFLDRDGDGRWTNGDLRLRRQPEEVYYFSKKLVLKKNWDRNEQWDINALSVELQKPLEIKTNKPKPKAAETPPPTSADDEDEDDYGEFGTGLNNYR